MIAMLRKALGREGDGEWEMPTSMMDVVFLLLVFFLCASQFRMPEQRLDALLPRNGRDGIKRIKDEPEIHLRVGTVAPGSMVPRFEIQKWVAHDANELAARLRRLPRPGVYRIVLDGEANCPFQHLMSALDACARAELTNVSFMPPRVTESG